MKLTIPVYFLLLSFYGAMAQDTTDIDEFLIAKGRIFATATFSLDQRKAENEDQLLRYVISQDRVNFQVIASSGYAIMDGMTLGLGIGYGRQREEITYENDSGQEITSNRVQQGLSIIPTMRTYVPLRTGRFQILVQTELGFTFGESLQRIMYTSDVDKIEGDFFEARLGVSPGAVLFFDRHWAFEVTVGLAGLSARVAEEVTNNDESTRTRVVESGIDFQINLLRLNLGVAYYL